MRTWYQHGRVRTFIGGFLMRLTYVERNDPYYDTEQGELFELGAAAKQRRTRRIERMELAVQRLSEGHTLRVADNYKYDVSFNFWRREVRVATRVLAEAHEVATYMGAFKIAGEIDWRATEMMPEDYYAA